MLKLTSTEMSWSIYDFGNSAYALLVMTIFYPLYFAQYVAPGPNSEAVWGGAVALSILFVGLLSPFLGAYADTKTNRKGIFVFFSIVSILGTMLLPVTGIGPSGLGILTFIAVNFTFGVSLFLYDSFLVVIPHTKQFSTTLSGLGWAIGYIGGPLCLLFAWVILGGRLPANQADYNITFIVTGLFFLLCVIWPFRALPSDIEPPAHLKGAGFIKTVWNTVWKPWGNKRIIFLFLFSMYFIMDGLTTIVYFVSLFAKKELGFDIGQIVTLLVIVQLVAIPATAVFCWIGEKKGEVRMLILCSIIWCVIVLMMYKLSDYRHYYAISSLTGLVIGSTPALARGFFSKIVPKEKRAELFGFNAFASRIATLIGPVVFGMVASFYNMRTALLTVVPFFSIGVVLLLVLSFNLRTHENADN